MSMQWKCSCGIAAIIAVILGAIVLLAFSMPCTHNADFRLGGILLGGCAQ